jgi:hypothetical protein
MESAAILEIVVGLFEKHSAVIQLICYGDDSSIRADCQWNNATYLAKNNINVLPQVPISKGPNKGKPQERQDKKASSTYTGAKDCCRPKSSTEGSHWRAHQDGQVCSSIDTHGGLLAWLMEPNNSRVKMGLTLKFKFFNNDDDQEVELCEHIRFFTLGWLAGGRLTWLGASIRARAMNNASQGRVRFALALARHNTIEREVMHQQN